VREVIVRKRKPLRTFTIGTCRERNIEEQRSYNPNSA
jgi:hypothetical protein